MDALTGSAPKATFSTQPTIQPSQQSALSDILPYLQSLTQNALTSDFNPSVNQTGVALQNELQTGLNVSGTPTQGQQDLTGQAFNALGGQLGYQAPQIGPPPSVNAPAIGGPSAINPLSVTAGTVSPTTVSPQSISAPNIDSSAVFQQSVLDPLNKSFQERTLPAIAGHYGQGAGGAYSSDSQQARRQAGEDLTSTEANYGAQFAYDTSKANQAATLAALQSNQSTNLAGQQSNQAANLSGQQTNVAAGLQGQQANQAANLAGQQTTASNDLATQIANLQASLQGQTTNAGNILATNIANQGAAGQAAQVRNTALGQVPSALTEPSIPTAANESLLTQILGGLNTAATPGLQLLQLLLGGATGGTQQTSGVGSGGSSGILSGLIPGVAAAATPGAGGVSFLGNLFGGSDERMKDDLEQVGEVGGFPLYRFKYKDDPARTTRIGLVAQDVEKRRPDAVGVDMRTGFKMVNYGKLVSELLEAA